MSINKQFRNAAKVQLILNIGGIRLNKKERNRKRICDHIANIVWRIYRTEISPLLRNIMSVWKRLLFVANQSQEIRDEIQFVIEGTVPNARPC